MTTPETPAPAGINVDAIIEQYIALRDAKDQFDKAVKDKTAQIKAAMEKLEGQLQAHFLATNTTSVKSSAGTAFVKEVDFVGVSDWEQTLSFIRENQAWELLNRVVNKTEVKKYIKDHEVPPPGVNYTVAREVQVRRA